MRRISRLMVAGLIAGLLVLPGCRFYGTDDPFYRVVPASPTVHPSSTLMASHFLDNGPANIQWQSYSTTVFGADADTPRRSVQMTSLHFGGYDFLDSVPIPATAVPDPSSDGHLVIIDSSTGCAYDFWKADLTDPTHPKAGWINRSLLSEDGVYDHGASARGSGFVNLNGLITAPELANGEIDHALAFNYHSNKSGGPVPFATESDGSSSAAWAIPEGVRLFLPRSFDLSGYPAWQQTIGRALQEYGAIDADNGGASSVMGFYALNPRGNGGDQTPYPWGSTSYPTLPNAMISAMKVEAWWSQVASQTTPIQSVCGSGYR